MVEIKTAIVTGGGSGIGLAIAEKYVQQNIQTIIVGRDAKKLAVTAEKLGPLCKGFVCDLNDLPSIRKLVDAIITTTGRIDVLVNNAGINMKKEFTEVTDEDFQRVLQTNVTAVPFPCR
ncbi:MAG TPA: SDR family oxidoreductase [Chitinophagaceae bacterium]|nr:SDR family oxidoreductase [Chitinophagaceae bacterium]